MPEKYVIITTMGEPFEAFIPATLPRNANAIDSNKDISEKLGTAETALAKLDIASDLIKSEQWFLYGFVRKEALLSSQIEGTQATLIDLLTSDENLPENPDLEEVCNYLAAIKYSWQEMENPNGLPLSLRMIKEAHRLLMAGVRGSNKSPGVFRKTQNWIGASNPQDAIFVPPPPDEIEYCLDDLEKFIHDSSDIHPLLRIGMTHVQFETIHPFLDGNGRMGRLLIALMLKEYGYLKSPLLYLSLYFKKRKQEYYRNLNQVRSDSSWEKWNDFFLDGIIEVAGNVVETAQKLNQIINDDRKTILANAKINVSAIRLFEFLPMSPIVTQSKVVHGLEMAKPTALKAINILSDLGILREITGKKRDRVFHYQNYLDLLALGTELK